MQERAESVLTANIIAGLGILGTAVGLGIQATGLNKDDESTFNVGMAVSIGFSLLRFSGVVASGVAATRYTRRTPEGERFKWGLFWGGMLLGAAGSSVAQYSYQSDDPNVAVILASTIIGQILMDLMWIGHCGRAARLTESHRKSNRPRNQYSIVPWFNPHSGRSGISLLAKF